MSCAKSVEGVNYTLFVSGLEARQLLELFSPELHVYVAYNIYSWYTDHLNEDDKKESREAHEIRKCLV